MKVTYRALF